MKSSRKDQWALERLLEREPSCDQQTHRPHRTDRDHQHHGDEKTLWRCHAEELSRGSSYFPAADRFGSGLFLFWEKFHRLFIKPAGIRCVFAKAVKHERILSHGGAQVNLPKLYCHDFVIDQQTQTAVRFQPHDASRQRFLVSSRDLNLLAAK